MALVTSIGSNGGANAIQEDWSFVREKRGYGQVKARLWAGQSETLGRSVACMYNLNLTETLTLTKWTDVRAAS
jgi:hypothetical protein